jgi:ferredoxin
MVYQIKLLSNESEKANEGEEASFPCAPEQRISQAAELAGYRLTSCDTGYCGACRADLIQGDVYLDNKLPNSNLDTNTARHILLCCVKPRSDIIVKPKFAWRKI